MHTRKNMPMFNWMRSFVVILLIGLLLPVSPVLAKTSTDSANSSAKHLPANDMKSRNPETGANIASLVFTNPIQDGSFEASFGSSSYWTQSSTNFGTPLCTVAACGNGNGTATPRSGSVWGWFGGTQADETATLSQSVTIATGTSSLLFYFWIGAAESGSNTLDAFTASIDGNTVFTANATQIGSYSSYTPIWINISAYADNAAHTLTFMSATTAQGVTFNLDDVSLAQEKFFDVPSSNPYYTEIEILYANGYTAGCSSSPLMFCPNTIMNRAQASVFMMRGNFGGAYIPPSPASHFFTDDWATATWAETWAEAMFTNNLTAGCSSSPLMFCPYDQLTNAQAAVFGLRLKYGLAYAPPTASGTVFADMTDLSFWGLSWAEQAYADGLIPACGTDAGSGKPMFCPDALVNRGFGASVIVKAKNLTIP